MSTRQNEEHIFYIGNCPVCYEYGRLEEIVGLEWDKYVVEASVPEDLELLGMYDKTKMEEA